MPSRARLPALADVDHEVEIIAAGLARRGDQGHVELGGLAQRPPAQLHRLESRLHLGLHGPGGIRRLIGHQGAGIGLHLVAPGAAEQRMDGLARRLAGDVPERDLDAADGMDRRPPPAVIERALVHLLPEPADLQRVLPDQQRGEPVAELVGGGRLDDRLGDGGRGIDLAQAGDAFVGMDAHQHAVLAAVGDGGIDGAARAQQYRLNSCDPHLSPSLHRWVSDIPRRDPRSRGCRP